MAAAPIPARLGVIVWLRANLFSSWFNSVLTLAGLYLLVRALPPLFEWGVVNAVWRAADPDVCKEASGACWALIHEKYRLILFGRYPYNEQWRPLLGLVLLVGMIAASCNHNAWGRRLAEAWLAALAVWLLLMWGGVAGLTFVPNNLWGGLPLTLILTVIGLAVAFPMSILLALGRRSRMPVIRILSRLYIELIRGVPLISLLFMASFMLPLFLPTGVSIDEVLRAQVAIILFSAAYLAEAVRGGLQAIPGASTRRLTPSALPTGRRSARSSCHRPSRWPYRPSSTSSSGCSRTPRWWPSSASPTCCWPCARLLPTRSGGGFSSRATFSSPSSISWCAFSCRNTANTWKRSSVSGSNTDRCRGLQACVPWPHGWGEREN